jgi:hypothetical protein
MHYPVREGADVGFPYCAPCERWVWPSAVLCPDCHGPLGPRIWSGPAVVVAQVRVHRGMPAELFRHGPYDLVKLDCGGFFFITRWLGQDAPRGSRCDLVWSEALGRPWPLAAPRGTAEEAPPSSPGG